MIDLIPIPQGSRCQEAAPWSFNKYAQCPANATTIIYHQKDGRGYYMCTGCAEHNIHNRVER